MRNKDNFPATVKTIEYDPNRSARIALVAYADGEKRYIIAPNGLKVGQTIESGPGVAPEVGNTLLLSEIPLGTLVHNVELRPGQGAAMARSAGSYAQLTAREGNHAILRLPSGETRMVLITCRATVGTVSNPDHSLEKHGKDAHPAVIPVHVRDYPQKDIRHVILRRILRNSLLKIEEKNNRINFAL